MWLYKLLVWMVAFCFGMVKLLRCSELNIDSGLSEMPQFSPKQTLYNK